MQNIRIGVVVSIMPVGVNPSAPDRWPSWKTHTIAPNVAESDSRFNTTAFAGTRPLPDIRNSTTNVPSPITPAAAGTRPKMLDFESTSSAAEPPTCVANGAGTALTAFAVDSPAFEYGS